MNFSRKRFTLAADPSASYKTSSIYPSPFRGLDFKVSNLIQPRPPCNECFPEEHSIGRAEYINLLDLPNYGGMPYPLVAGARPPWRFLADLRYAWKTPLPHRYPSVRHEVINGHRVAEAVSIETKAAVVDQLTTRKKAVTFYYEIRATLNRFVCKICGYLLFKIFRRLMVRLLVNPAQMKSVQDAEKTGIPLVYLPLHRSHLDYLLITWNSWHFGLRLPHIASGDNLNLSGFGWLLRGTGAFFIRRRLDAADDKGKDQMYRTVLRSYLEEVLKKNLPIEFFLEGTRSRFGKALLPKNGLVSNVVEAVQQGCIGDVYLVPVSYTYDQVAEGVFLQELMGNSKQRESIWSVFKGIWKGFGFYQRCGTVRMHYGKPVLLSEYLSALSSCSVIRSAHRPKQLTRLPHSFSYRELVPWSQSQSAAEFNRALIRSIGFHVVYEAQEICSISPVSIVSTLLLSKYRNDSTMEDLANDAQWLAEQIIRDGGDVVGWRKEGTTGNYLLEYALPYMKDSITRNGDEILPVKTHRQRIQLAYGKNALLHRFSLKAVLAISLLSRDPEETIFFDSVIEEALLICDWLQYETIFAKPCESLRQRLRDTLDEKGLANPYLGSLRISGGEEEGAGDQPMTLKILSIYQADVLMFYSNFVRSFVQTMFIVMERLTKELKPCREIEFVRQLIQQTLARPASEFPFDLMAEAANSDTIKNCLRTLRDREIITNEAEPLLVLNEEAIKEALRFARQLLTVHLHADSES